MLREPFGKYKVAVSEYEVDYSEGKRKIPMMFFFPSDTGSKMCPYKDAAYQKGMREGNVTDNGVKTYCYTDGTLSSEKEKYPVVMYSHGLNGFLMESTVLCADLASNGYIVVSIGHPLGTEIEGDLKKLGLLWEEDISFAMESLQKIQDGQLETCFSGRLAIEDGINLLGVSFGGCCSIGTLLKDSRAKCAINLDGRLFIDVELVYTDKPVLVLCNPLNYTAYAKLKKIAYPNLTVKKYRKVTHWEFSDGIYLSERGKSNRQWADEISENRARLCMDVIMGRNCL